MYKAEIIDIEFNWQDFYGMCIHYNHGDGREDMYYYDDKDIAKLAGMTLEEYRNFCRNNFNTVDVYKEILFDWRIDVELALKWLNERLVPLNVLDKLSKCK